MKLKAGKLPPEFLLKVLKDLTDSNDRSIIIGPGIGFDSAVIDIGDRYLVISSDPITFVTDSVGYYTIAVNINDVAVTGAEPRYLILTVLLPDGKTEKKDVERIFEDIKKFSRKLGISVIGGHTEVTIGIDHVITSGTVFGYVEKDDLVRQDGARPGDIVIMTKFAGVEGTSIISREKDLSDYFSVQEIEEMRNFNVEPGILILDDVRCIKNAVKPTTMHDPTEGGIAQALHEIAIASGVGILVFKDRIPVHPYTRRLASIFSFDPLGLISSGALLATVPPDRVNEIIEKCKHFNATVIGEIKDESFGRKMLDGGKLIDLPEFPQDEITKIL